VRRRRHLDSHLIIRVGAVRGVEDFGDAEPHACESGRFGRVNQYVVKTIAGWLALTAVSCWLFAGASAAFANAGLPASLESVATQANIDPGSFALIVHPIGGSEPLVSHNGDKPLNPASAIKAATAWAALEKFGPAHQWTTEVFADGEISDETLTGDLVIRGDGDPFLVIEDLWRLLRQVRYKGVRTITGDLVIDDSKFATDPTDPGSFDEQPHRLYNVIPTATLVNFNAIEFVLKPNSQKGLADVHIFPPLENLRVESQVKLSKRKCKGTSPKIVMSYPNHDVRNHIVFTGSLPSACKRYRLNRTAMTAAQYLYGLFQFVWSQWNGELRGQVRAGAVRSGLKPLVQWRSKPLGELVRPLNKWSNNVMARTLTLNLGATLKPIGATKTDGQDVMMGLFERAKLPVDGVRIDNGSGLSRDVRATGNFFSALLRRAWAQPTMPEFVSSLSIAGKDGTTKRRYRHSGFSGQMHLKTGQIDDVVSVVGYVQAKSGKRYAAVFIANQRAIHRGRGHKLRDAVLNWLFNL